MAGAPRTPTGWSASAGISRPKQHSREQRLPQTAAERADLPLTIGQCACPCHLPACCTSPPRQPIVELTPGREVPSVPGGGVLRALRIVDAAGGSRPAPRAVSLLIDSGYATVLASSVMPPALFFFDALPDPQIRIVA